MVLTVPVALDVVVVLPTPPVPVVWVPVEVVVPVVVAVVPPAESAVEFELFDASSLHPPNPTNTADTASKTPRTSLRPPRTSASTIVSFLHKQERLEDYSEARTTLAISAWEPLFFRPPAAIDQGAVTFDLVPDFDHAGLVRGHVLQVERQVSSHVLYERRALAQQDGQDGDDQVVGQLQAQHLLGDESAPDDPDVLYFGSSRCSTSSVRGASPSSRCSRLSSR